MAEPPTPSPRPGTSSDGWPGPDVIEAAGVIVWRRGPDGPEVLLIHRPRRNDWSLAKGKREPGELLPQAAVRETAEETGLRPVLGRRLRSVQYLASGRPKCVHYWAAAHPMTGSASSFTPNDEVDGIEWLSLPRAYERLSYADDAAVLDDFAQWPYRTAALIIMRHASAGDKRYWDGDDLLRPLDPEGRAEALVLVPLLACFDPVRIVSSPAVRCTETVASYAAHIGAPVEVDHALTVPGRSRAFSALTSPDDPVTDVARLLAAGVPALICAHRENIPQLLGGACKYLGAQPPSDPSLPKAGFWVLQAGESMLAGLERYELPRRD
jgi:8-oxo-(d)GTP phosphatase